MRHLLFNAFFTQMEILPLSTKMCPSLLRTFQIRDIPLKLAYPMPTSSTVPTFVSRESSILVALIYLVLTGVITLLMNYWQKRMHHVAD